MLEKIVAEYQRRLHAMQSGVAACMGMNLNTETSPKHLRTGVNAAMADQCGLVTLLIHKGVITREEYLEAIKTSMGEEVERYEKTLSDATGKQVTLV